MMTDTLLIAPWDQLTLGQQAALTRLAASTLLIPTLEVRNGSHLDFYDVAVWSARDALALAFLFGEEKLEL